MKKDTKIELENEETEYTKTEKGSKSFQDTMNKLDELETVHNKVVKSSRLLGRTEGSLITLGVLALGFLVKSAINRK